MTAAPLTIELIGSVTLTIPIEMKVGELQETVTVTGASPVVDVQNTRRETVITADAIQALPATRAYGSLLNAMPGVTVDNNGLAATATMTFFSAHGGRTNEGRMSINGMTVAAACRRSLTTRPTSKKPSYKCRAASVRTKPAVRP